MINSKRGVSPFVATILLVGFVIVIIIVIWLWSRNIYVEQAQKEGALAQEQIKCNDVKIEVERRGGTIEVRNIGTLPIRGFKLREDLGDFIRLSDVYVNVPVGESFPLVLSDVSCDREEEPSATGALCSNSEGVEIFPALQPEGRGAPLVDCKNSYVKVKSNG